MSRQLRNEGRGEAACGSMSCPLPLADIAAWFLAEIQRKSPAENGFELEQKDGIPLSCNLSTPK